VARSSALIFLDGGPARRSKGKKVGVLERDEEKEDAGEWGRKGIKKKKKRKSKKVVKFWLKIKILRRDLRGMFLALCVKIAIF
jgi:hypothetical protein